MKLKLASCFPKLLAFVDAKLLPCIHLFWKLNGFVLKFGIDVVGNMRLRNHDEHIKGLLPYCRAKRKAVDANKRNEHFTNPEK